MLKYRIIFAASNGQEIREIHCGWVNMPQCPSPLIEFMGPDGNIILAVNSANVALLELLEGNPVTKDNKIFDPLHPPVPS